jgi:Rad3-related DNA helicase
LANAVHAVVSAFPTWDRALPGDARTGAKGQRGKPTYQAVHLDDIFVDSLSALADGIGTTLEQLAEAQSTGSVEVFLAVRDASLMVNAFLSTLNRAEVGYVTFLGRDDAGGRRLKIFCVDPSHDLDERLQQAKAAIFFSGTLLPMDYHRRLLAAQDDDTSLYVQSSFDHRRQQVLIGSDLSARYAQRGPELYAHIAAYLTRLTDARPGNYLVFLPSYVMMDEVAAVLDRVIDGKTTVILQVPGMREADRERFVDRFRGPHAAGRSLIGLCVLGGIFGESIDLPGESLVGVVVVGTGMPRSSAEREVIRNYFDAKGDKGFAFAYTYPGLNKVLQAAGRLIRTETDHGIVLLLDDRFLEADLQEAFPKEWKNVQTCTVNTMTGLLAD